MHLLQSLQQLKQKQNGFVGQIEFQALVSKRAGDERGMVERKEPSPFSPETRSSLIPLVACPRFAAILPTDRETGTAEAK